MLMSPAEMARCGKECRMNATWHPRVIGLPVFFEPDTPSPADTAWYPRELLKEARYALQGIRCDGAGHPMWGPLFSYHSHDNFEPWRGVGMWSEWRAPPLFPNHPAFIHPAILQDPTSWDNVMWETDQMNARAAATIYVNILWKGIFANVGAIDHDPSHPERSVICALQYLATNEALGRGTNMYAILWPWENMK